MNKFVFRFKKNRIDDDTKLSMSIMSIFVILMLQFLALMVFNIYGTRLGSILQLVSKLVVGIFFLMSFNIAIKRSLRFATLTYLIATMIIAGNYLIYPDNWVYLQGILSDLLILSLPSLIYSYSIRDIEKLLGVMNKASFITFFSGLILWGAIITGRAYIGSYSMSFSYYLLLPAIYYIAKYFEERKISNLMISLSSVLIILSVGSRGPIFAFLLFVFLYMIFSTRKLSYKKSIGYTMIVFLFFVAIFFIDKILLKLSFFLDSIGVSSRSIRLFLQNDIHLSGRDNLYTNIFQAIIENPILGIGIAGDRVILNGAYSHNIFLEVLSGFGIIIGLILLIIFIALVIIGLFVKDRRSQITFTIWICIGFIPLLVSGSYLINYRFWIFIGLILGFIKNKKRVER